MKLKFSFVSAYLAYTFSVLIVGIAFLSCKSNKTAYVSSSGSIKNISFAGYNAVEVLSPYIIKGSADSWSFNSGLNATNQVSESSVSEFIKLVNSSNGIFYKHCFYTGCRYERASKKMNSNYMGCYLSGKYVNTRVVLFKKKELEQTKNIIISNDEERNCFCQMMNNSSVVQTAVKTYDQEKENDAYNNAMSENSISKLQDFLRTYPSTQFRNKVTEKINDLDRVEKSRRAADEVAKKTEVDRKRKIIQEKGPDYVYDKGEWTSSGLFNEMYCDIIFADETKARIYSVREGYYFWAFREKIYYETESSAIKAAYEAVTKKTLSNTGRIFPGTISSSSSSSSNDGGRSDKIDYENISHPRIKEYGKWEDAPLSEDTRQYIMFEDGTSGYLFNDDDGYGYHISEGLDTNHYYKTYEATLRALYVYRKYSKIIKRDQK